MSSQNTPNNFDIVGNTVESYRINRNPFENPTYMSTRTGNVYSCGNTPDANTISSVRKDYNNQNNIL